MFVLMTHGGYIHGVLESEEALERFVEKNNLTEEAGTCGSGSLYKDGRMVYGYHSTVLIKV